MSRLTKIIGYIFFGSWSLAGTFFYLKAIINFIT